MTTSRRCLHYRGKNCMYLWDQKTVHIGGVCIMELETHQCVHIIEVSALQKQGLYKVWHLQDQVRTVHDREVSVLQTEVSIRRGLTVVKQQMDLLLPCYCSVINIRGWHQNLCNQEDKGVMSHNQVLLPVIHHGATLYGLHKLLFLYLTMISLSNLLIYYNKSVNIH